LDTAAEKGRVLSKLKEEDTLLNHEKLCLFLLTPLGQKTTSSRKSS